MTELNLRRPRKLSAASIRGLAVVTIVAAVSLIAISCRTVNRTVVALPDYPGAKYVGSRECEQCHEEIYRDFQTADHARLIAAGPNAINAGCESCHGPGSVHSESGGEIKPPFSFGSGRPRGMGIGAGTAAAREVENVCYQCHADIRGQFALPSHHPVPEGKMTCTECHSPHKGSAHRGGGTALRSHDETCLNCHPAQRGPFVFEHEAMREGCTTCHGVHGTINAKLLTVRDSNLCLKCHPVQREPSGGLLIGGFPHGSRLSQGTCWTAGCHEAVHGSRVNSSLRF